MALISVWNRNRPELKNSACLMIKLSPTGLAADYRKTRRCAVWEGEGSGEAWGFLDIGISKAKGFFPHILSVPSTFVCLLSSGLSGHSRE